METIYLLRCRKISIFRQLQIEEALLRADQHNWCLLNEGVEDSIVMGISAKPKRLLNCPLVKSLKVPVVKRFTGGGTVVVDKNTVFVSFIYNENFLRIPPYPESVMRWSADFYQKIFCFSDFSLKENDYVFGDRKFGGNAQYMRRSRWLHHTSFLWDFDEKKMSYLLKPEKAPSYRQNRSHVEFLCRLRDRFFSKEELLSHTICELRKIGNVVEVFLEDLDEILSKSHRKSTCFLEI